MVADVAKINAVSLLSENDPLWFRLWTWRHRGSTIDQPAPVGVEECKQYGLDLDPWPLPSHVNRPKARVPADAPAGVWEPVSSGSRRVEVLSSDDMFLRVATPNATDHKLRMQVEFLQECGWPAPELVSFGEDWLATRRIDGVSPDVGGPWVAEMMEAAMGLRERDELRACLRFWRPDTSMLSSVLSDRVVSVLEELAKAVPEENFVSHGDLQCKNVLVREGRLSGIVDFEAVALAPLERDVAIWCTALAGQIGLEAVGAAIRKSGVQVRPLVLAGCLVHSINKAAASAARRFDPAPYVATVEYLAEWLAGDPEQPYRLLNL